MKRIALYVPALLEYCNRLAEGVRRLHEQRGGFELRDFRYQTDVGVTPRPPRWDRWQPDGIIAMVDPQTEVFDLLVRRSEPIVNTTPDCPHEVLPAVHVSFRSIGSLAAAHFRELGFEHFGFVGVDGYAGAAQRERYFAEQFAGDGHMLRSYSLKTNPTGGLDWMEEEAATEPGLLDLLGGAPKPLAVLALNDGVGRAVCQACRQLQLAIPQEVAVLGVDDTDLARSCSPPLSSIHTPGERVGYEAMRLLERLILGERPPGEPIQVPATELAVRQSTSLAAGEDDDIARALRMIRRYACQGLRVGDVVKTLSISRSTFEHRFAEAVGRTPGQEIARVRLERAKELLTTTKLSVTQIGAMVGYRHIGDFDDFFKRRLGQTPREYRKANTPSPPAVRG